MINDYNFKYDVSYPVLVTLHDPSAFDLEGFTLQFAMEVNMRNNRALTSDMESFVVESIDAGSLFTDPDQRNSGDITIKTVDAFGTPISGVNVKYICGEEELFIGISEMQAGEGVLTTKLPLCVNGYVGGFIEDYFVKSSALSLDDVNQTAEVVVVAEKIVTRDLSVKIKAIDKMPIFGELTAWQFLPNSSIDMHPDEDIMLIFTRQQAPGEQEFVKFLNFNGSDERFATVDLISGSYQLEGFLMRNLGEGRTLDEVVIPEKEICVDTEPLNPFGGEECHTIPEIIFNETLYRGGIKLSETHGALAEISLEDLHQNDELEVYVIAADFTDYEDAEDLEYMGKAEEYSATYYEDVMPEWVVVS
jgi:hypothetical protein